MSTHDDAHDIEEILRRLAEAGWRIGRLRHADMIHMRAVWDYQQRTVCVSHVVESQ